MAKVQKQVCDMRAGKRMAVAQSNEHLRIGDSSAWNANRAGNLDPTRTHLNFEIGKGGVVKEVDQRTSIPKRIKAILDSHSIKDPNVGLSDERLKEKRIGVRTHCNIILEGSRETMRKLAFGNQDVNYEQGSDNSYITRAPEIEKWAQDMYNFMARKYGEENIAAFVAHLDETLPHIHCTIVPITESGKLSYREVFAGNNKYEFSKRTGQLHSELAEVNKKWGLERGDSIIETGAEHKSYLQWMKEQIRQNGETITEQDSIINKNATTISEQKLQLYAINAEIKKATKKVKALSTMIANLEGRRRQPIQEMAELEEKAERGEITQEELEKMTEELQKQVNEIDAKIEDKKARYEEATVQLRELALRKHKLQNSYDELQRKINKDLPTLFEKTQRDVNATMWEEITRDMKKDYSILEDLLQRLPHDFSNEFSDRLKGTVFEEVAQKGEEIAGVAAALFLGYIDQATTFAQGHGGGGGPGAGWGREKDEDDEAYRRRCCIMARMMMKPVGRKNQIRR